LGDRARVAGAWGLTGRAPLRWHGLTAPAQLRWSRAVLSVHEATREATRGHAQQWRLSQMSHARGARGVGVAALARPRLLSAARDTVTLRRRGEAHVSCSPSSHDAKHTPRPAPAAAAPPRARSALLPQRRAPRLAHGAARLARPRLVERGLAGRRRAGQARAGAARVRRVGQMLLQSAHKG